MKQSIRNQVFETNSSSIHSLSIMNYSASEYDLDKLTYDIDVGEFGWEHDEYCDPETILTYLWTLANTCYDFEKAKEYKERLKEWCPNVHFIDYPVDEYNGDKYFDCHGYVDHGNDYELDKIFESKQRVADLVFNGLIRTTNDNSYDGDEIDEWVEPKDAKITFWKGN